MNIEDEILETVMFTRPPEWGRRVIRRGNEILLQGTSDKGVTWRDMPIPEFKLIIPSTTLRSATSNPYKGLVPESRLQLRNDSEADTPLFSPELQSVIDSGSLLSLSTDTSTETVTFLGAYPVSGLASGQIWRDENNYLRITP